LFWLTVQNTASKNALSIKEIYIQAEVRRIEIWSGSEILEASNVLQDIDSQHPMDRTDQ